MHAAALYVDLRLRDVHSLKAKRHRLKKLSTVLRGAYPVAFSEVNYQDLWQRAAVGVALVSPHASQLDIAIHAVKRLLDDFEGIEVLSIGTSYIEDPSA